MELKPHSVQDDFSLVRNYLFDSIGNDALMRIEEQLEVAMQEIGKRNRAITALINQNTRLVAALTSYLHALDVEGMAESDGLRAAIDPVYAPMPESRKWPTNPYDAWTVDRALRLARGARDRWGDIPDAEGRIPGVQFFALSTLAEEVERLRSISNPAREPES